MLIPPRLQRFPPPPQVVGPVAVTSTLLANGLANIPYFANQTENTASPYSPNQPHDPALQMAYNHAAIQIAFVAGCFYTGIGILRMGAPTLVVGLSVSWRGVGGDVCTFSPMSGISQLPEAKRSRVHCLPQQLALPTCTRLPLARSPPQAG